MGGGWHPGCLSSNPTFAAYQLCKLGKLLNLSGPLHIIFVVVRITNNNDSKHLWSGDCVRHCVKGMASFNLHNYPMKKLLSFSPL